MSRTTDRTRAAAAAALYASGLTSRQVAAELGAEQHTVLRWIGDAARRKGPRGRTDVDSTVIAAMRDRDGMSWQEIADALTMSRTGVRMRYLATTGRPRPGRPAGRAVR